MIIFSSLITDDLRHKGQVVGADAQISKPEIAELVRLIDRLALIKIKKTTIHDFMNRSKVL